MAGDTLPETDPYLRQKGLLKGWRYHLNSYTLRGKVNVIFMVVGFWSTVIMYRRATASGRAIKAAEKQKAKEAAEEETNRKMYAKY